MSIDLTSIVWRVKVTEGNVEICSLTEVLVDGVAS